MTGDVSAAAATDVAMRCDASGDVIDNRRPTDDGSVRSIDGRVPGPGVGPATHPPPIVRPRPRWTATARRAGTLLSAVLMLDNG